ncbi:MULTISPECIES: hypothetical protein [Burkholderia cepacia complex]|uniref:hypothetical protein n=1 Tax=Burkholderia cepacia complex TaxID=87882 RepID=UPI001589ED2E|nr:MULTISPECIES: hypothetical protein [Burkholderia cepacia complex]MDR8877428.1 hypothetical protein [Burkholderia multivorans]MDR8883952.1 hypothetical protein [Burkholderia multivorans]MDR8890299.1 hypothetical protein [Burkholderia multivorans]MDR8909272.1 hypothetical protein [Burkholderia multivorans]MDR8915232.1 hypothetical protein [Burkholderia multivorans]
MDDRDDDIFIVGLNITKHAAYFANKQGDVTRVVQGVYFRNGKDVAELFEEYGIRLAKYLFQNAALTHSTAWYKKPVDGRVFVGGDYPYNKVIAPHAGDYRIAQSMVHPKLDDPRMYETVKFADGLGEFEMACATPEMTLIQLMDATKRNVEKHLPESEVNKIVDLLQTKYGSRAAMLVALEEIAADADKRNEFDRLMKQLLSRRRLT